MFFFLLVGLLRGKGMLGGGFAVLASKVRDVDFLLIGMGWKCCYKYEWGFIWIVQLTYITLHPFRFSRDRPRFNDTLDVIKFLCKDLWTLVFRKQVDNLKTNHRVLFALL